MQVLADNLANLQQQSAGLGTTADTAKKAIGTVQSTLTDVMTESGKAAKVMADAASQLSASGAAGQSAATVDTQSVTASTAAVSQDLGNAQAQIASLQSALAGA